jgi:sporulation protein YlmC with PRC-barrel domain
MKRVMRLNSGVPSSTSAILPLLIACTIAVGTPSFAQYGRAAAPAPQADPKNPAAVPAPSAPSPSTRDWRAAKLIGATMTDALGNSVGTVQDIVIDADGKVVAVLVSVGGFLGLGDTTVAIGLRHLTISMFDTDRLDVTTSLSREAIQQAARFEPDTPLEREAQ